VANPSTAGTAGTAGSASSPASSPASPASTAGTAGTKDRIIEVTAKLFRRYGYHGAGMKQIVANASATFGSVYHFFPGGKEELGVEVLRRSGQMYLELAVTIVGGAPDVATGVGYFFGGAAEVLRQSDYIDACPIETVALEVASTNEALRQATADVFESWVAGVGAVLASAGIREDRARELAIVVICALEGAFVLSRAARTTEAVERTGAAMAAMIRAAVAECNS
jgi:AcrR family transcriptional regulator